ncbi:MAG: hypothetical protein AAFX09_07420 [Pseudomonadota bacterium]
MTAQTIETRTPPRLFHGVLFAGLTFALAVFFTPLLNALGTGAILPIAGSLLAASGLAGVVRLTSAQYRALEKPQRTIDILVFTWSLSLQAAALSTMID